MQNVTPFFSNDIQGFLKVVGTFGTIVLLTAGIFVKWGQSAFAKRLDKIESDLDKVGSIVNGIKTDCTTSNTRHEELRARLDRKESVIETMLTEQGKQEASISSASALVNTNQNSLIVMLNDQMRERDKEITALKVEIGRLQERNDTRAIVKDLLVNLDMVRGKS